MPGYGFVSFTTDYGLSDGFVAACHGVIARLAPAVRIIDVTHLVPPGDVTAGANLLAQTVPYLPPAVHLAVVDPGVGTNRRPVALHTAGGLLVGPDNGLLPGAAAAMGGIEAARELNNPTWLPSDISHTFHGRDIFAPVAARLAAGAPFEETGTEIDPAGLVRLPDPVFVVGPDWLEAEVLSVDRFGNVQLAAPASTLQQLGAELSVNGLRAVRGTTFADAPVGGLVVLADSAQRVAVAVNGGRAAVVLSVTRGDVLRLELAE